MIRSTPRPLAIPLTPLAFIGAALMAWLQWHGVTEGIWVDSDVYVMGARTLSDGGDLYANASAVDLRFTYSPFAATLFVPLALLPVEAARWTLTALSVVALLSAIVLLGRKLRLSSLAVVWLVLAAAALEPILRNLLLGQINLILMTLVLLDLLVVPQRYRGLLVGIAAGIKLTPAVFVIYFLLQRDWRSAARAGAGFGVSVLIGLIVAPSSTVAFWGGGFLGLGRFGADAVVGTDNQSLLAVVLRVLGQPEVPLVVQAGFACLGVALGALAARRSLALGGPTAEVAAVAWIALGGLLASPVSWTHHWVWIIVAIAVLVARREHLKAALVLAAFWFPLVWMLYTEVPFAELRYPWWKALLSAVYVVAGLVLLSAEATRRGLVAAVPRASRELPATETTREPASA